MACLKKSEQRISFCRLTFVSCCFLALSATSCEVNRS